MIVQHAPSNSSIVRGIQLIHDSVKKLQEIAYYIALKEQPVSNFKEQLKIEQMHDVKYSGAYENDKACKNIISGIAEYFFEENIKNKLLLLNF